MADAQKNRNGTQFFMQLAKIAPMIVSAALAGAGIYYSLEGMIREGQRDLQEARREIERLRVELDEHNRGFTHGEWFGIDRILHPSLRSLVERYHRECSEKEHGEFETTRHARSLWESFFDRNPDLRRPRELREP